jgi:hypothetical protein
MADLRANALHARQRYRLYIARTHGSRPTSSERLRELALECERAESRLAAAEAEERRLRETPPQASRSPSE